MTRKQMAKAMIESLKNSALAKNNEDLFLEACAMERHEIARNYRDESYTSKEEREALMVSDPLADERLERTIWEAPKKRQEI